MTKKLNRENLISDRYRTYADAGRVARRTDRDEIWFFDPVDCRTILSDTRLSAKRGGASDKARSAGLHGIAAFFEDWLMFRDDDKHLAVKKKVLNAMRRRSAQSLADFNETIVGITIPVSDVIEDFSKPYVSSKFAQFFDIELKRILTLIQSIRPAIELLGKEEVSVDTLVDADQALRPAHELLGDALPTSPFVSELMDELKEILDSRSVYNVLLNLIADGLPPTVNALSIELLYAYGRGLNGPEPHEQDRELKFYTDAPFQYIARRATEKVEIGGMEIEGDQRVVACIGNCARLGDVDVVFGFGRHGCPGRVLAEHVVSSGIDYFKSVMRDAGAFELSGAWADSIGYRELCNLTVIRSKDD